MAIPEFVDVAPVHRPRTYSSPPRRPGSWVADRPGDLAGRQPRGASLGSQGPDQGYALTLAELLAPAVHLQPGEHLEDVLAGAAAIASRRSSRFGRAPISADVRVGLAVWGFLVESPAEALVAIRRAMFAGIHHPHSYERLAEVADAVPVDVLAQPVPTTLDQARADWHLVLSVRPS